jgi:hypothetical protein
MLLLAVFLVAAGAASFNFTNSTYSNTTSTSTSKDPSIVTTTTSQDAGAESTPPCDTSTQDCLRPEEPFFDTRFGTYDNPYYKADDINPNDNETLRHYCATEFDMELSKWLDTAPITQESAKVKRDQVKISLPQAPGQNDDSEVAIEAHVKRDETSTANTNIEASIITASYVSQFTFTASQPCCYTCTVHGGRFSVFQWDTETDSPPTSTYVNNLGFTL